MHPIQKPSPEAPITCRAAPRYPPPSRTGYQEFRTSDLVAQCLTQWGYEVERGLGGTGVVGQLRQQGRQAPGLRAGMTRCRSRKPPARNTPAATKASCARLRPRRPHRHAAGGGASSGQAWRVRRHAEPDLPARRGRTGGAKRMMEDGLFSKYPATPSSPCTTCPAIRKATCCCATARPWRPRTTSPSRWKAWRARRDAGIAPPIRWSPARPSSWACKASWPATSIRCTCR